jgi:3-oxoacyl-[acyl-carrier protein] reductase
MFDFSNKKILVTGANRGIGLAITKSFLEYNGTVIFHCRENSEENLKTIKLLSDAYGEKALIPFFLDLNNSDKLNSNLKELVIEHSINVLVNNAGITHNAILQMCREDELYHQFKINFFSPFKISQLVLKKMVRAKEGVIVNIASTAAFDGNEGKSIYGASKSSLITMSKSLSREVGPYGIRVNCIAPGITKTDMLDSMSEEVINQSISNSDLRRPGLPEEIAMAVLFLASDYSSYITGQTIRVDGGM